ncbi:hypothetical protein AX760_24915 [Pararhizobium antarcticum]|uniref:CAAX prenyl protease 2/Lysostaphin resistance protein A-like domain-containing protein n=2 Tax=Pararhizobium antarcticum TaxID=1798805 RepID=A0A657LL90_9HYPH|nr:hypothetical protein AX760_24915 [Pararhizobium antarcticum]OJF90814.1 hypothetical protein AX761_22950 [Rhizobium sp. 58]
MVFPPQSSYHMHGAPNWSAAGLIGLWLVVVLPMAGLSLGLAPILIDRYPTLNPGLIFWATIIVGMAWQFVVSVAVLVYEGQRWTWPELRKSLWLVPPQDPISGRASWHALWVVLTLGAAFVLASEVFFDWLDALFAVYLPGWMRPQYGDITDLATPANAGNWWILWMALVSCLFNYVLGEALFFHGILLPRMEGAFGRWAWLANGIAFGSYHVHKAAVWPTMVITCLAYSLPSQYLRSIWPAVFLHGVEGVILIGAVLFVVLGGLG